jgi:hypothetical protein
LMPTAGWFFLGWLIDFQDRCDMFLRHVEDVALHNHHCENFKSYINNMYLSAF